MPEEYKNPVPTVDIIIELTDFENSIVLITRKNPPLGLALPGGFLDYEETLEDCAIREAKEETNLDIELVTQLKTYSDPKRDLRQHTISTVFIARAKGEPKAGDDAKEVIITNINELPDILCFDHRIILNDYLDWKQKT